MPGAIEHFAPGQQQVSRLQARVIGHAVMLASRMAAATAEIDLQMEGGVYQVCGQC